MPTYTVFVASTVLSMFCDRCEFSKDDDGNDKKDNDSGNLKKKKKKQLPPQSCGYMEQIEQSVSVCKDNARI